MMMNLFVSVFQHRATLFNLFYLSFILHFMLVLELLMGFQDETFLPTQSNFHTTLHENCVGGKRLHIGLVFRMLIFDTKG